ncbi:MAG: hypothetical protein SFX19_00130 [Alphaproteobacteria bacterium]|nr:hypothetical protein [Alphaproteobacteria bacterium]
MKTTHRDHDEIRKITINLPASLIDMAMLGSEKSLTETIREALKRYAHHLACQELLALKGKVKFSLTYEQMKALRD